MTHQHAHTDRHKSIHILKKKYTFKIYKICTYERTSVSYIRGCEFVVTFSCWITQAHTRRHEHKNIGAPHFKKTKQNKKKRTKKQNAAKTTHTHIEHIPQVSWPYANTQTQAQKCTSPLLKKNKTKTNITLHLPRCPDQADGNQREWACAGCRPHLAERHDRVRWHQAAEYKCAFRID